MVVNAAERRRRTVGGVLLSVLLLAGSTARAQNVQATIDRLNRATGQVTAIVARSFAAALPVPSAAFGVQYSFDPATGSFVRAPATSGQAYVERGETLGARRFNVSVAWERVELDSIGGQPADRLPGGRPIRFVPNLAFAAQFSPTQASAVTNQIVPTIMFGVTDSLDVGLTLPLIHSNIAIRTGVVVAARGQDGTEAARAERFQDGTNDWDVGDLLLRAKLHLPSPDAVQFAAGLSLRLPTGDLGTLRGSGTTFVSPRLIASSRRWSPASWATLQAHLDAAVEIDAEHTAASIPHWGLGLDWGVSEGATLAIAFLGRHPLRRLAGAHELDLLRCPSLRQCLLSPRDVGLQPLYGIDTSRPDYFDFSIGGRIALWRDTVMGFANVVIPLNTEGVRFDPLPLVGIEATF